MSRRRVERKESEDSRSRAMVSPVSTVSTASPKGKRVPRSPASASDSSVGTPVSGKGGADKGRGRAKAAKGAPVNTSILSPSSAGSGSSPDTHKGDKAKSGYAPQRRRTKQAPSAASSRSRSRSRSSRSRSPSASSSDTSWRRMTTVHKKSSPVRAARGRGGKSSVTGTTTTVTRETTTATGATSASITSYSSGSRSRGDRRRRRARTRSPSTHSRSSSASSYTRGRRRRGGRSLSRRDSYTSLGSSRSSPVPVRREQRRRALAPVNQYAEAPHDNPSCSSGMKQALKSLMGKKSTRMPSPHRSPMRRKLPPLPASPSPRPRPRAHSHSSSSCSCDCSCMDSDGGGGWSTGSENRAPRRRLGNGKSPWVSSGGDSANLFRHPPPFSRFSDDDDDFDDSVSRPGMRGGRKGGAPAWRLPAPPPKQVVDVGTRVASTARMQRAGDVSRTLERGRGGHLQGLTRAMQLQNEAFNAQLQPQLGAYLGSPGGSPQPQQQAQVYAQPAPVSFATPGALQQPVQYQAQWAMPLAAPPQQQYELPGAYDGVARVPFAPSTASLSLSVASPAPPSPRHHATITRVPSRRSMTPPQRPVLVRRVAARPANNPVISHLEGELRYLRGIVRSLTRTKQTPAHKERWMEALPDSVAGVIGSGKAVGVGKKKKKGGKKGKGKGLGKVPAGPMAKVMQSVLASSEWGALSPSAGPRPPNAFTPGGQGLTSYRSLKEAVQKASAPAFGPSVSSPAPGSPARPGLGGAPTGVEGRIAQAMDNGLVTSGNVSVFVPPPPVPVAKAAGIAPLPRHSQLLSTPAMVSSPLRPSSAASGVSKPTAGPGVPSWRPPTVPSSEYKPAYQIQFQPFSPTPPASASASAAKPSTATSSFSSPIPRPETEPRMQRTDTDADSDEDPWEGVAAAGQGDVYSVKKAPLPPPQSPLAGRKGA